MYRSWLYKPTVLIHSIRTQTVSISFRLVSNVLYFYFSKIDLTTFTSPATKLTDSARRLFPSLIWFALLDLWRWWPGPLTAVSLYYSPSSHWLSELYPFETISHQLRYSEQPYVQVHVSLRIMDSFQINQRHNLPFSSTLTFRIYFSYTFRSRPYFISHPRAPFFFLLIFKQLLQLRPRILLLSSFIFENSCIYIVAWPTWVFELCHLRIVRSILYFS